MGFYLLHFQKVKLVIGDVAPYTQAPVVAVLVVDDGFNVSY